MKALILDSGILINFSMNGILDLLVKLKENFDGKFLITEDVKKEVYDVPINIRKFELGALKIKELIDSKIIEFPDVSAEEIEKETNYMMDLANKTFQADGQWVKIVSRAEMSCLALSNILTNKGTENIIAIDERTTRIFFEKPENLARIMESKLHKKVIMKKNALSEMKKFRFVRSPEIAYAAYKKGLVDLHNKKALEALLYATKYKGASISTEEIEILKKI